MIGRTFISNLATHRIGKWVWRVVSQPRKNPQGKRYVWATPVTRVQCKNGAAARPASPPDDQVFLLPLPK